MSICIFGSVYIVVGTKLAERLHFDHCSDQFEVVLLSGLNLIINIILIIINMNLIRIKSAQHKHKYISYTCPSFETRHANAAKG